ncbi:MAG: TonB-dependent receptor [Pyrinomonadaceae bacterium]
MNSYPSRQRAVGRLVLAGASVVAMLTFAGDFKSQQSITSATLSGQVVDPNQAVVPGATVTALNVGTNRSQSVITDVAGRYRFLPLAVGDYRISATAAGFATPPRVVTLSVGQSLDLRIQLEVEGTTVIVDLIDPIQILDTARTQMAEGISPAEVQSLPLNGRNFVELALIAPGVSRTNTGSVQKFAETSAVPGTGISFAGQRNISNGFIVDGLSANDDAADLTGTYYSQEVVNEFQVITSGGTAEFTRASAGVVNIVTRAGSNEWHGAAYGYLRNQRFDARNPLAPKRDLLTQGQFGATISGALRKERTFIFANFEQTRRNDSNVITIAPGNVATINSRLNAVGYRGPRIETGLVPGGYDVSDLFGRLDQVITVGTRLSVTYNFYDIIAVNARTVGGLNALSRGTGLANRDQTTTANLVSSLTPIWINEARFQYRQSQLEAPVNDGLGPAVNISGVANLGTATSSPLARDIDLIEVADTVGVVTGQHSIKFGGDFLYNRVDILFPGAFQGVYNFSSLNNFLTGNYVNFQQAFGAPSQFQSNPNIGLFIQDEWRANKKLTFNLGLRYDAQFLPSPIQTDANNFAPRFGVAYAPGDRKTVIRASFGLYYDRVPLRATSNALQRDGSKYIVAQFSPTQVGAPVFPYILAAQPAVLITKPGITRIDPNVVPQYGEQANLQIERELPGQLTISAGYLHMRGLQIILSRNVNVPRCTAAVDPNLCRPDPNFGNISRYESSGDSWFDGLVVSANKRAGNWATLRLSYTYSKTLDDAGNFFFFTPQDNFNRRGEKGLSDNDQRHRLVLSGTLTSKPAGAAANWARKAV